MKKLSKHVLFVAMAMTLVFAMSTVASAANPVTVEVELWSDTANAVISDVTKVEQVWLPELYWDRDGCSIQWSEVTMYYVPVGTTVTLDGDYDYQNSNVYLYSVYEGVDAVDVGEPWFYYSFIETVEDVLVFENGYPVSFYELKEGVFICVDSATGFQSAENGATPVETKSNLSVVSATSSMLDVDGDWSWPMAYNIADNNYFKLRDIAYLLKDTEACFEVTWNGETGAIDLTTGQTYTSVGGELDHPGSGMKLYTDSTAIVYIDGVQVALTAYTINDNNYYKLRDLGEAMGFNVSWDSEWNRIVIATDEAYTAD